MQHNNCGEYSDNLINMNGIGCLSKQCWLGGAWANQTGVIAKYFDYNSYSHSIHKNQ